MCAKLGTSLEKWNHKEIGPLINPLLHFNPQLSNLHMYLYLRPTNVHVHIKVSHDNILYTWFIVEYNIQLYSIHDTIVVLYQYKYQYIYIIQRIIYKASCDPSVSVRLTLLNQCEPRFSNSACSSSRRCFWSSRAEEQALASHLGQKYHGTHARSMKNQWFWNAERTFVKLVCLFLVFLQPIRRLETG